MGGATGTKHFGVVKPGYHIRPKYDLKKTRGHVKGEHKKSVIADLPLVSMIDMFTILIIFLLMNFSATGEVFFIQKDLKLPDASHGKALESAPLISIVGTSVIFEAEKVGENPMTITENDQNLPRLAAALKQVRIIEETIHPNQPFKGKINIQADEKTPLVYIKRVMQTCISEGWTNINFAVNGTGGGEPQPPAPTEE
ncbi:MAG: biopolymer transporter ExbD [Oligoflexia bacterium]|nr:biopolymer transporter ExbD [Oligoflexia bacterium]